MSYIPQTLQKSVTASETVHNGNIKTVQLPLFLSKKISKLINQLIDAIKLNNLATCSLLDKNICHSERQIRKQGSFSYVRTMD